MHASSRSVLLPDSVLQVREVDFASRRTRNPVPDGVIHKHVRLCMARELPEIVASPPHGRAMVIAGSGPSLRDIAPEEGDVFALGGAHEWLLERGIIPCGWINADPLPLVADYIRKSHENVTYYLASHSHPFVFDAAERVIVWHDEVGLDTKDIVIEEDRNRGLSREHVMITGGSTGAMRAPFLGYEMGYRLFIFYGVDSSGGRAARALRIHPDLIVECGGREFAAPSGLIHQAVELEVIMRAYPDMFFDVRGNELMAQVYHEVNRLHSTERPHSGREICRRG